MVTMGCIEEDVDLSMRCKTIREKGNSRKEQRGIQCRRLAWMRKKCAHTSHRSHEMPKKASSMMDEKKKRLIARTRTIIRRIQGSNLTKDKKCVSTSGDCGKTQIAVVPTPKEAPKLVSDPSFTECRINIAFSTHLVKKTYCC